MSPELPRRIFRRALADQDIHAIVDWYLVEAGPAAALGFIDALERAFTHLARQPGMGSPRYGHDLGIPGLRSWSLRSYPYMVFYFEAPDALEVWRVLHSHRDIPVHLQDDQ